MDYWCALWFWPIDKADELPDRGTWLFEIETLLDGIVITEKSLKLRSTPPAICLPKKACCEKSLRCFLLLVV